jgi:hydroxyacylglutathione hydrolase
MMFTEIDGETLLQKVFSKNSAEIAHMLETKKAPQKVAPYLIVDIRNPEEYAAGHVPSSISVPMSDIESYLRAESAMLKKLDIVYFFCWAGNTSQMAAMIASSLGIRSGSVQGGMMAWEWMHLPLEK